MTRVNTIAERAAEANGVELVHCELAGTKRNLTVRVYIDKADGVTVDDCSSVSREMEKVLDAEDFIPSAYLLEVSSPGLERGLFKLDDYKKFSGKKAKIKTSAPIDGQSVFSGLIEGVEGEEVILKDKAKGQVRILFSSISQANLRVDLAEEFKRRRT
ncbi:MAG: ribosome maturation factor RimP [Acidobacteria bacterium]|nr:ribosome maturation factor RimP [Acidobacteriota bacterium]